MRVCLVYDCLFPLTVGGAERWYRNLAIRLADAGHDVTYLTLRQWDPESPPHLPGVRVIPVGPRMDLYSGPCQRRILPTLVFGAGVLRHLLLHGRRYDVIHTASFPYFSVLAAAFARPFGGFRIVVDWHEVWSRTYWLEYLGRWAGDVGWLIQRLCARVPQRAFCFSRLHARRLEEEGIKGTVTVLRGEYEGPIEHFPTRDPDCVILFLGRLIPEKRASLVVDVVAALRQNGHRVRGTILGDGPELGLVRSRIAEKGLDGVISAPGFVSSEEVEVALETASCLLLPSRREGYGMVIIEASRVGTPSVVIAEPDNAAVELISLGENGTISQSADIESLSQAVLSVLAGGAALRERTSDWFSAHADTLSLSSSLDRVLDAYIAVDAH